MRPLFIIVIFCVLGIYIFNRPNIDQFILESQELQVERVTSSWRKTKGLSGRDFLDESAGMLFAYSEPDYYGIWMPKMKFAIDIIWFDELCRVVDFKENVVPESYPEIFKPKIQAYYILEVNAGFIKRHAVSVGSKASGC